MSKKTQIISIILIMLFFITFLVINEKTDRIKFIEEHAVKELEIKKDYNDSLLVLIDEKLKKQKTEKEKRIHDIDSLYEVIAESELLSEREILNLKNEINNFKIVKTVDFVEVEPEKIHIYDTIYETIIEKKIIRDTVFVTDTIYQIDTLFYRKEQIKKLKIRN